MKKNLLYFLILILSTSCVRKQSYQDIICSSLFTDNYCTSETAQFSTNRISHEEWAEMTNVPVESLYSYKDFKYRTILQFQGEGFPPGSKYDLYSSNLELGPPFLIDSFQVMSDGSLRSIQEGRPLSRTTQFLGGFMNAEPVYYSLISEDKKSCYTVKHIPTPVEFFWSDGAHFELTMLDRNAQVFKGTGKGFRPLEEFHFESKSGKEKLPGKFSADSEGNFCTMLAPAVLNQTGGTAEFTITRPNNPEKCVLRYYWGTFAGIHKGKIGETDPNYTIWLGG